MYLETDELGVSLSFLQVRGRMQFLKNKVPDNVTVGPITLASKSLTSAETWYHNMWREILGQLHGLEKFWHNCFTFMVSMITVQKSIVAIFKQGSMSLSDRLQRIVLHIHQHNIGIL